jgi:hypothetical protein
VTHNEGDEDNDGDDHNEEDHRPHASTLEVIKAPALAF